MANDLNELIQLQERLYCKLSDPQEKLIVRNYIENLKREKSKLDFLNNMKISTKGKLEFTRHVLDVCLEKTNEELRNLGMIDFMFYLSHKDQAPLEYRHARIIFMRHLKGLFGNISSEIITGLEEA